MAVRGPQWRLKCKITGEVESICAHWWEKQVQPVYGWFPDPSDLELQFHSYGCVTSLLLWLFPSPCPYRANLQHSPSSPSFGSWQLSHDTYKGKQSEKREPAPGTKLVWADLCAASSMELSAASVGQPCEYSKRDCTGKWGKQDSNCWWNLKT